MQTSKLSRITLADGAGHTFFNGGAFNGDPREQPRLDNPFLSTQAHDLIVSQLVAANGGVASDYTGDTQFTLRENLLGLGVRQEQAQRDTYRIVAGLKGTISKNLRYDVSANYGEFNERTKVLGNLNVQRFVLALDSTREPNGNIVCRSKVDPAAAFGYANATGTPSEIASILATDIATCVPINPFGEGNISRAARNYVISDTVSTGKITQFVASGFVSGDTGGFFKLPGGPIGFSLGAEYRRETNSYQEGRLVEQGYTFYNALPTFHPPAFEVTEGFGELRVPLLAEKRLFHELTLSGAGRVAGYKGSTGIVYAYNGGVDWAPVRDIRFRANYARAVRAPNLVDLYTPQQQNFAGGVTDPCALKQIGTGSPTRVANCRAAGIPADYDFVYSQSLQIISGGNPNLKAETSDSYTYGAVIRPRWVPGLSVTADYYNISVNNVITAPAAQDILNACYDLASLANPFCSLFQRAGPNGGPRGEVPGQVLEASLLQTTLNYAKLQVRGIDTEISFARSFGLINVGTRLVYTHQFQNDQFLTPTEPGRAQRLLSTLSNPEDEFNWNIDVKAGHLALGYKMRYISHMLLGAYENIFSFQGRPPQNADFANVRFYPEVFYHDVRFGVDIDKRSSFYMGVDNVTDVRPPYGLTGIGAGSGIYDNRGRFFYAGIKLGLF